MWQADIQEEAKRLHESNPLISQDEMREALEKRFLNEGLQGSSALPSNSFMPQPRDPFGRALTKVKLLYYLVRRVFVRDEEEKERIKKEIQAAIRKIFIEDHAQW